MKRCIILGLCMMFASPVLAVESNLSRIKSEFSTYQSYGDCDARWDSKVEQGFKIYEEHDFSTAIRYLEDAYQAGCRDGLVLYRLAFAYGELNDYQRALVYARDAYTQVKKHYSNHYYSRTIGQLLGKSFFENGNALYKAGRYEEALNYFKNAYQYRDTIDRGRDAWMVAATFEELGNYQSAYEYWKKSAEIYGESSPSGSRALKRSQELRKYVK